jgi:predicted ATPase
LYSALVKNDEVKPDVYQLLALRHLERLWEELVRSPPGPLLDGDAAAGDDAEAHAASTSSFGSWFYSSIASASPLTKKQYSPIRGVYLHGGVGCGKTFLANLLYDSIQEGISGWKDECQKHHFHRFMLNVHQEMHRARYNGGSHHYSRVGGGGSSNPSRSSDTIVPAVVDKIVRQGRLVYLDEFQGNY